MPNSIELMSGAISSPTLRENNENCVLALKKQSERAEALPLLGSHSNGFLCVNHATEGYSSWSG
jgi:hypothetical protein